VGMTDGARLLGGGDRHPTARNMKHAAEMRSDQTNADAIACAPRQFFPERRKTVVQRVTSDVNAIIPMRVRTCTGERVVLSQRMHFMCQIGPCHTDDSLVHCMC